MDFLNRDARALCIALAKGESETFKLRAPQA